MTPDHWLLIAGLSASTIGLRLLGYFAGTAMLARPFWRRVLTVFPGCLITALVASALAEAAPPGWIAAAAALATAMLTRNILATMAVGMAAFAVAGGTL
ncbi:MAG: AzlD domain-containing protein [Pseudomonadota bacterium]